MVVNMLTQQEVDQIWRDAMLLQECFFGMDEAARQDLLLHAACFMRTCPVFVRPKLILVWSSSESPRHDVS